MEGLTRDQINLVGMLPGYIRAEVSDLETFTALIDYDAHTVGDLVDHFGDEATMSAFCRSDLETVRSWVDRGQVDEFARPRVTEGVIRAHLAMTALKHGPNFTLAQSEGHLINA